jgi:hypothetical protein
MEELKKFKEELENLGNVTCEDPYKKLICYMGSQNIRSYPKEMKIHLLDKNNQNAYKSIANDKNHLVTFITPESV